MSNRVRVALFTALSLCVAITCGASLALAQSTKEETTAQSTQEETTAQSVDEDTAAQSTNEVTTEARQSKYTKTFPTEDYLPEGENPYFILRPGHFLELKGREGGEKIKLTITVLDQTEVVDNVTTRVVEEREFKDGKLFEVSRNFFAIGAQTNSAYYFGEDVDFYNKKGEVISHEGSWRSGVDGAKFGLQMPGIVLLGSRYFQETAPGVALDRAEHVSMTADVDTPAGKFRDTLKVRETTPLEPKVEEFKFHAPGVGLVKDGPVVLTCSGSNFACGT
jgi:hypothetical protein